MMVKDLLLAVSKYYFSESFRRMRDPFVSCGIYVIGSPFQSNSRLMPLSLNKKYMSDIEIFI
jgi:hypothetical protein